MKHRLLWVVCGIVTCLVIMVAAYLWTSGLMDSSYAYRSPLAANPPAAGQPDGSPLTRRVVFVLVDALREDTSLRPDVMPFLSDLRSRSAWAMMHSRPPSYSSAGYTTLLTGAWPDLSDGHTINVAYDETRRFTQDDLLSAAHRAGLRTAISGYYWFERMIPPEAMSASFYTPGEDAAADRDVVDAALPWLRAGDYQLTLIHIDQVDYAGHHEGGPRDPRWAAAAQRADDLLREIVATLDLTRDTLFVCSDHGQIDQGGHGGQDPIALVEPWVLVGAGVRPGHYADVQMVDVAPTLAALLGASIPASSQGRAQTEMLALPADRLAALERAMAAQQTGLAQAYGAAIGRPVAREESGDAVTAAQAEMTAARSVRLRAERLPRILLAVILAFIPAAILYRRRGPTVGWMLVGAALFVVLFNLRYAVWSERTYSLSSVASADDLIFYTALTTAAAFLLSWFAVAFALRRHPREGAGLAQHTLAFTLVVVYVQLLPVLASTAINGLLVTWTLPDFLSTFLGFLSGLQALFIAPIGLVLTAIVAAVDWAWRRTRPS